MIMARSKVRNNDFKTRRWCQGQLFLSNQMISRFLEERKTRNPTGYSVYPNPSIWLHSEGNMPSPDEVTDNSSRPSSGKSYHSDFSGIFSSSDDESQPAAQPAAQPAPPAPAPAKTHNALFAQSLLRADRVHCTPAAGYRVGYTFNSPPYEFNLGIIATVFTTEPLLLWFHVDFLTIMRVITTSKWSCPYWDNATAKIVSFALFECFITKMWS